jgi:parallel beta-helix repeat protein
LGKKTAIGILLTLLVTSIAVLAFNVQPAKSWTGTVHIRADGSIDPPDATIFTLDNVTYTLTGNITSSGDGIVVERDNIVIDGASYSVQGTEGGKGIDLSYITNVTVKNARIDHFDYGLYVNSQGRVVIEKNEISGNSESGIFLVGKSNILIEGNIIKQNRNGIATDAADTHSGIVVRNNTIMFNQEKGIYLYSYSSGSGSYGEPYKSYIYNVTVSLNNVSSNAKDGVFLQSYACTTGYGFAYSHIYDILFSFNNVSSNNENGICLYSRSESTCERGEAYIYNVVIANSTISSNRGNGIDLQSYASVGWLSLSGYGYGYIHNVVIANSTISSNSGKGIFLYGQGSRSTDVGYAGGYAYIYNVNILSCTILLNNGDGVYLHGFGYGSVYGGSSQAGGFSYIYNLLFSSCNVSLNGGHGINLYSYGEAYGSTYGGYGKGYIHDTTFSSNMMLSNNESGIKLYSSSYGSSDEADYIYNIAVLSNNILSNKKSGVYTKARNRYGQFDLTFANNTVSVNYQKGIWIEGGPNANLTCNSISYNLYGVFYVQSTSNLAQCNDVYCNSYGMYVTDGATVNAEHNYWGNTSGPYHESLNVNGTGNSVNGNGVDLDFIPFLTEPVGQIIERPAIRARLTVGVDPVAVIVDQDVTIAGILTPGMIGANITIFYRLSGGTWTTLAMVQTDINSDYIYTWKTTDLGTYEIKAGWAGNESILPGESETKTVTVQHVYIKSDGSISPSTAPIQRNGNMYIFTDNIQVTIMVERNNIIIDGNGYTLQGPRYIYGFYLNEVSNVTVRNTAIRGFTTYHGIVCTGVLLKHSNGVLLINNNMTDNSYGVFLWGSSNNKIYGNNIINNDYYGIVLCLYWYDGYDWYPSSNNTIFGNTITNNNHGIFLEDSAYNTIFSNEITNNDYGVWVVNYENSFGNIICGNNVTNNYYGVGLVWSSNNKIYHNNFINNSVQTMCEENSTNVWDDGYPSGGNYWSNYFGVDADCDGMGDTSHIIDVNNTDRYPLIAPITIFDAGTWNGVAYSVDIISNSTLSDFKLNVAQKTLSFNVTGIEGKAGFCRVTIPNVIVQDLWQGNFTVLLNGEPWPFRNWTDTTNTYIYINYTHSEHEIIIVPEVPSAITLPLFMSLILVAAVLAKKRTRRKLKA